jgi:aryl-alcohol dehydrogenase-like predicted oxidoreductase
MSNSVLGWNAQNGKRKTVNAKRIMVSLGKSNVQVTPIAFGAWAAGGWMWGGNDHQDSVNAIRKSIELGITTIDTAPVYGFGLSEQITGEAIKPFRRDEVQILTKFGLRWDTTQGSFYFDSADADGNPVKIHRYAGRESVIRECEESLRRLGTDYIDLLQIHWADPSTPISETMEAVAQLLQQGKIRAAGVCNYDAAQMAEALKTVPLASNQVPYSMVKRDIERETVPFCIEHQIGILAYSPLQRGLLTGKISPDHAFAPGDHRPTTVHFKPENIRRTNTFLEKIKPLAADKNATLAQVVIQWTLAQPGITCALVGARNAEQAAQNAAAAQVKLTAEEVATIDAALSELELVA